MRASSGRKTVTSSSLSGRPDQTCGACSVPGVVIQSEETGDAFFITSNRMKTAVIDRLEATDPRLEGFPLEPAFYPRLVPPRVVSSLEIDQG